MKPPHPRKFVIWHQHLIVGRAYYFYTEEEAFAAVRLLFPDLDTSTLTLEDWHHTTKLSRKQARRGFFVNPEITYKLAAPKGREREPTEG